MKCLRCGYCCIKYMVVIVNNPDLGVVPGNLIAHPGGKPCKHLLCPQPVEGPLAGRYACAIHHKPWYKETPCYEFGQVERSPDEPCRIGTAVLNGSVKI
jgi:hypothetical protein